MKTIIRLMGALLAGLLLAQGAAFAQKTVTGGVTDSEGQPLAGVTVMTCGTCLDFYGIREKLAVGGVTNLYEIAKAIAGEPGLTTL